MLILLLLTSIVPIIIISYVSIASWKASDKNILKSSKKISTYSTGQASEALEKAARSMLDSTTTYETSIADLFFKGIEKDVLHAGKFVEHLINNKMNYKYKWNQNKYIYDSRGALVSSRKDSINESQIWVSNKINITTEIKDLIALTEHLDPIYKNIKDVNKNIEWIYVNFDVGVERLYPWFDTNLYPSGSWDLREREYYKMAKFSDSRSVKWSKPYIDALGKGWMVTASLPLYDKNNKFIGVQSIDVTIESLINNILNFQIGQTGYAFLLDKDGDIITLPDRGSKDLKWDDVKNKSTFNILQSPDFRLREVFKDVLSDNKTGIKLVELNGVEKYFAHSQIKTTKWHIGVLIPRIEIIESALKTSKELESYIAEAHAIMESNIKDIINRAILGIIITALFVIVISIVIANRLVSPIKNLTEGTRIIADGNLDYNIEVTTNDEVGRLASSFNAMVEKLKKSYEKLEGEIKKVKDANLKLDLLQELSKTISHEFDIKKIFNKIITGCTELLEAEMGYFIITVDKEYYEVIAATGEARVFLGSKKPRSAHPIVEDTLKSKNYIFIKDISNILKYNLEHIKMLHIKEIISAPIYVDNEPVGVIQVFNSINTKKHLKEEDVEILKLFIPHAEIAIKNSRIYNQIEENRKYISNLIKNIPNPLIVFDKNKSIIEINDISKSMFNIYKNNILNKNIFEIFDEKYTDEIKDAVRQASIFGFASCEVNIKKDDIEIPTILNFSTVKNENGELLNILMVITDITELKNREEELYRLNRELDRAVKAKTLFLANMSHELRSPLNAIIGFSEVLMNKIIGDLNEKQIDYLKDIYNNGKHLLSLINDILDISKIEVKKMDLKLEKVEIKNIIEDSLIVVKELANKKKIKIEINCNNNINPIEVDVRRVNQILYNLLSNAVKFTPEEGKVTIIADEVSYDELIKHKDKKGFISFPRVLSKYKKFLKISITDTGIGIAENDMDRIFKPFEQINTGLSRKYEGTGLGLALVKELVELHSGTITVESKLNEGSNFTFYIPYRDGN